LAKAKAAWGIAIRLEDASRRFYCKTTGRSGQPEWSPRANQARRYDSREGAQNIVDAFKTNGNLVVYEVVELPRLRP